MATLSDVRRHWRARDELCPRLVGHGAGYRARRSLRCALWMVAVLMVAPLALAQSDGIPHSQLNRMCPVMEGEPTDPSITVTYKDKKVAFCCTRCVEKFERDPEAYLDQLPQFQLAAGDASDESDDDEESEARMPYFGRLHPALVHFPIAGVPMALLALLVSMKTRRDSFAHADAVPLFLATLAAGAAYWSGNVAEEASKFSAEMHEIAEQHETLSTIILISCIVLSAFRIWRWKRLTGAWRGVYAVLLLAICGLLGWTGFLGGSLVFGPDHLIW